jgi:hypothetical protein
LIVYAFIGQRDRFLCLLLADNDVLIRGNILEYLGATTRPEDFEAINAVVLAEPEVQARIVLREVRLAALMDADQPAISGKGDDLGADGFGRAFRGYETDAEPVIVVAGVIAEKRRGPFEIDMIDENVDIPIVVDITEGCAAAGAFCLKIRAGGRRGVRKRSFAVVRKQRRQLLY